MAERRLSRYVFSALGRIGSRSPRLALVLADAVGRTSVPFRRHSWREVCRLLPDVQPQGARRILRSALMANVRDRVVTAMAQVDGHCLDAVVRDRAGVAVLQGPLVLATVHIGSLEAVASLFRRRNDTCFVRAYGNEEQGAAAFVRATETLRRGGLAIVPVDAIHGARVETTFFGSPIVFTRGAFALSRVAQAPIRPLLMSWRGHELHTVLGEAIGPVPRSPDGESIGARALALWLEQHFSSNPGDIGLRAIKRFAVRWERPA